MKWIKGIALFLIANFLIYLTLSITVNILINIILSMFGIDVCGVFSQELLVWSLVIGFGGAFISLAFSKQMARSMLESMDRFVLESSHNGDGRNGTSRRGEEQKAQQGTSARYATAALSHN